ncbi:MAG: aspartate carbamoyltransferase catalytic subunit [Dehalococcoidia bacterium]|nr:aspartate carbamoyltransferase catalytic subunit [Dehalococcoidia bacterium]
MANRISVADLTAPTETFRPHVLDLDDFSPREVEVVFEATDVMKEVLGREIKKVPALRGKTLVNLFYEASTRTRVSFELAAKNLSADVVNIAVSGSSVAKGESLLDTIRTLQALGADMIVMRHSQAGAPYLVARHVKSCVLNAGDGWHAHPSQALLDLYTMRERLGRLEGLKVVIVGDILHSRVARSNIWGLTAVGARVVLCAPPTLIPFGLGRAEYPLPEVEVEYNLDRAIEGADVVMALRIQKERHKEGLLPDLREYVRLYQIDRTRLARAKPHALLMHPGPVNEGIELAADVVTCAQSVIQEQVANGVAVRMALLYLMGGGGGGA